MKTQAQMYYDAERKSAELNNAFLELVCNNEITNEDLRKLIEKRPERYGRFAGFVGKLPDTI